MTEPLARSQDDRAGIARLTADPHPGAALGPRRSPTTRRVLRYHPRVPPHPAAALLSKRWDLLAHYKDDYWRSRKKLGLREALRVVDSLRTQAQFFQPDWPTQEDRDQDLETHIRVSAALARTAPKTNDARRESQHARKARSPARAARRNRRVR